MATSEREFSVKVTVDDKGSLKVFDDAARKVADLANKTQAAASNVGGAGQAFVEASLGAAKLAAGFVAAGTAAVGAATAYATLAGVARAANLNDLAQKVGVSALQLSQLELAAKTAGVGLEGLGQGLKFLARNMAEAQTGSGDAANAFRSLGVAVTDSNGNLRDSGAVLTDLAKAFSAAADGPDKTAASLKLLGRAGAEMVPFLNQGKEEIERLVESSKKLGLEVPEGFRVAADRIGDNMDIIKSALTGVQTQLGAGFAEAFAPATDAMVAFVEELGIGNGVLREIGATLGGSLREGLRTVLDTLIAARDAIRNGGFDDAVAELADKMADAAVTAFAAAGRTMYAAVRDAIKQAFSGASDQGSVDELAAGFDAEAIQRAIARRSSTLRQTTIPNVPLNQQDLLTRTLSNEVSQLEDRLLQLQHSASTAMMSVAPPPQALDALDKARAALDNAGDGADGLAKSSDSANNAMRNAGRGAVELSDNAKAAVSAQKQLAEESQKLSDVGAVWAAAAKGSLTYAEAQLAANAVTKGGVADAQAAANARQALVNSINESTAKLNAETAAIEAGNAAFQASIDAGASMAEATELASQASADYATNKLLEAAADEEATAAKLKAIEANRAALETQRAARAAGQANADLSNLRAELALRQQVVAGVISQGQANRVLAVEQEKQRLIQQGFKGDVAATAEEFVRVREQITESQKGMLNLGDTIRDAFSQTFDAVISGTRDLGEVWEGLGVSFAKSLFDATLEKKFSFDKTFQANILDLGGMVQSILGGSFSDVFSGAGQQSGGFVQSILSLFGGGGGSAGGGLAPSYGGFTGVTPDGAGYSGVFDANTGSYGLGGSTGSSAYSLGAGIAGGLIAYAGGSALTEAINGTDFRQRSATDPSSGQQRQAQETAKAVGAAVGAVLSIWLGPLGGVIGSVLTPAIEGAGNYWLKTGDSYLRKLGAGGFGGWDPGATAIDEFHLGMLFPRKTFGTRSRSFGEQALDENPTFKELQERLGDIDRGGTYRGDTPDVISARSRLGGDASRSVRGFAGVFAESLFSGAKGGEAVRLQADQWTNILTEFFGRIEDTTEARAKQTKQLLNKALGELGVDAPKGFELLNNASARFLTPESNQGDIYQAQRGAQDFADTWAGLADILDEGVPAGTNIASVALRSLEKDGVKAFDNLDKASRDFLANLKGDDLSAVVKNLTAEGFRVDTEEMRTRLEDITQSASVIGEGLAGVFSSASVEEGVDGFIKSFSQKMGDTLKQQVVTSLLQNTAIGQSFEGVFKFIRENANANLADPAALANYKEGLKAAIRAGGETFREYLPILKELFPFIETGVEEAVGEGVSSAVEKARGELGKLGISGDLVTAEGLSSAEATIRGAFGRAVSAGLQAGLAEGATLDDQRRAFNESFRAGIKDAVLGGILEAVVSGALLEGALAPLLTALKATAAQAWADGILDGGEQALLGGIIGQIGTATIRMADSFGPVFDRVVDLGERIDEAFKPRIFTVETRVTGDLLPNGQERENGGSITDRERNWRAVEPRGQSDLGRRLVDDGGSTQRLSGAASVPTSARLSGTQSLVSPDDGGGSRKVYATGPAATGSGRLVSPDDGPGATIIYVTGPDGFGYVLPDLGGGRPRGSAPAPSPRPTTGRGSGRLPRTGPRGTPTPKPIPVYGDFESDASLGFDSALSAFAGGGALEELRESVSQTFESAVIDGLVEGLLARGPIAKALDDVTKQLNTKLEDALKDGIVSASEAEALGTFAKRGAERMTSAFEALKPVFEALGISVGDGVEKAVEEKKEKIAGALDGAVAQAFQQATGFGDFEKRVKAAMFGAVFDGIATAFAKASGVAAIASGFANNVAKALEQLDAGEITQQQFERRLQSYVDRSLGALNDPKIQAAFAAGEKFAAGLREQFGINSPIESNTQATIENTTATQELVNATTESLDLRYRMARYNAGQAAIDYLGSTAGVQLLGYNPINPTPVNSTPGPTGPTTPIPTSTLGKIWNAHLQAMVDDPGKTFLELGLSGPGSVAYGWHWNPSRNKYYPDLGFPNYIPGYATGGIAGLYGEEIIRVGEREPEAIIPISRLGSGSDSREVVQLMRQLVRENQEIRRELAELRAAYNDQTLNINARVDAGVLFSETVKMGRVAQKGRATVLPAATVR